MKYGPKQHTLTAVTSTFWGHNRIFKSEKACMLDEWMWNLQLCSLCKWRCVQMSTEFNSV